MYNFDFQHRLDNPDGVEARVCKRLLNDLVDQTLLVQDALDSCFFYFTDIRNRYSPCEKYVECKDCRFAPDNDKTPREIYHWVYYPATERDRNRLDTADIPYLKNDYGTWIGITSFGTSWNIFVVAELADAMYN